MIIRSFKGHVLYEHGEFSTVENLKNQKANIVEDLRCKLTVKAFIAEAQEARTRIVVCSKEALYALAGEESKCD